MSLLEKSSSILQKGIGKKIILPEKIKTFSSEIKQNGKTIATLNGSFDILHLGHLEMLAQASQTADILFVLLNSDLSIQTYKSPRRPIRSLQERLYHVAALEMVDFVSWFEETDPCAILEKIRPHVHVNGSDYGENCIEADVVKSYGGKIHIVELVPGYSTTKLMEKIKIQCD